MSVTNDEEKMDIDLPPEKVRTLEYKGVFVKFLDAEVRRFCLMNAGTGKKIQL